MKHFVRNTILVVSAFALALAPTALVSAEEDTSPKINFRVSPVGERLTLDPGAIINKEINITNQSEVDARIRLYAAPYTIVDQDYSANYTNETARTQISRWISFDQEGVTVVEETDQPTKYEYPIAAGETFVSKYTIAVPDDVANGGQYAVIFVESVNDDDAASSSTTSIKANYRIGVPILANIGGITRDGANIIEAKLPVFYIGKNNHNVTGSSLVNNTGNTDFPMVQALEIKTIFGREVFKDARSNDVFPDTERAETYAWEETPTVGIFWATYTVNAIDQEAVISHLVVILPTFVIVILILLLTVSIIWLIVILGKRREKAAKVKLQNQ